MSDLPKCHIEGCSRPFFARGLCKKHWREEKLPPLTVQERVIAKIRVVRSSGCWEWTGTTLGNPAYGAMRDTKEPGAPVRMAHRLSYEAFIGPIPEGLQIDHLCRNRQCVNPWHLEPVTGRENKLRGQTINARNAAKTHCPQGHPYDETNTIVVRNAARNRVGRACRACRVEKRAS